MELSKEQRLARRKRIQEVAKVMPPAKKLYKEYLSQGYSEAEALEKTFMVYPRAKELTSTPVEN